MSFNIGQALIHGAESFLMSGGNPIAAGIGAVSGGLQQDQQAQAMPQLAPPDPDFLNEMNQLFNFAKAGA